MSDFNPAILICTYGDIKWAELAAERALPSANAQTYDNCEVVMHHGGDNIAESRNMAVELVDGDQLIFLDADDELDLGYVEAMRIAYERNLIRSDYRHFLYQPSTLGIVDGVEDPYPVMIEERSLDTGNFMVIGTMIERSVFEQVGGFEDWPVAEDWDLFTRCWLAGSGFLQVPDAIYKVHVNPEGRNSQDRDIQVKTFNAIRKRNFGNV